MKKETKNNQILKDPPSNFGRIFCFRQFIALTLFICMGAFVNAQAIVKVDDAKQSFGTVKKGDMVELSYTLTNIGNEPLLIQKYEVQCSCTSVEFDTKPIVPGRSTIVKVKFDTKTVYERQDRIVYLISNNKNGDVKLRFKGFVKRN